MFLVLPRYQTQRAGRLVRQEGLHSYAQLRTGPKLLVLREHVGPHGVPRSTVLRQCPRKGRTTY